MNPQESVKDDYKPKIGRPPKSTDAERERRARERLNYTRKHAPRRHVEPWRCQNCGGWINLAVCLKCHPDAT